MNIKPAFNAITIMRVHCMRAVYIVNIKPALNAITIVRVHCMSAV